MEVHGCEWNGDVSVSDVIFVDAKDHVVMIDGGVAGRNRCAADDAAEDTANRDVGFGTVDGAATADVGKRYAGFGAVT